MAVHTHVFARLARSVARANGMPTTRQVFVPQPVVGRSEDELRAYIDGEDPVNGGSFMQLVVEGLTKPLDDEDLAGVFAAGIVRRGSLGQAAISAGEGAAAAKAAHRHLGGEQEGAAPERGEQESTPAAAAARGNGGSNA